MKLQTLLYLLLLLVGHLSAQEAPVYRLKANDTVRLTVFQESDLSVSEKLTVAGEVSFPLIGSVRLLGLSIAEAEKVVTAKYEADYLVSPSLSINVMNAADEIISVLGAVNSTGNQGIPVNGTLDLVTALDSAGGLASHADPDRIELKRDGQTYTFKMAALRAPDAEQVILQHGDRINVPASPYANKSVTILGQVKKPGVVNFPISGQLSLDVLLATSGGLTEIADPGRLTIQRDGEIYSGKLGVQQKLAPGDLVIIPASRFAGKFVILGGNVGKPGQVPFPLNGKLTALNAITLLGGGFDRLANRKKVTLTRMVNGESKVYRLDCDAMQEGKIADVALQPDDRIFVPERIF
jgi:polysaccharide export outer membrane protein